jgi:AcrR family transcriptional regulator
MRRRPIQERSRRRLDAILGAAAHLFAEQGFDATTVEGIAAQAGSSVGAVYQFFPNKLALFRAVAEQCLDRARTRAAAILGPNSLAQPWPEVIDATLDGFAALGDEDPAFRALWVNQQLYNEYAEQDARLADELVETTAAVLASLDATMSLERRCLVARIIVNTITAMLFLSRRESPEDARALRDETKVLLRRYLTPILGDAEFARPAVTPS